MKFKKRNIQIVDHSTGQTLDFPTFGKQAGEEAINELEQNVDNKIAELKSLVGTPLKASTASAMNNRDKIYVYTGNETGYTNGHWYYYDGTNWADGGVYNSSAVNTDKTLSVEDIPADAKKTGDEISELKEDLIATNAEVTDIRVGADGTTYNSAGAAVRGQISDLNEDLKVVEEDNLLKIFTFDPLGQGQSYVKFPIVWETGKKYAIRLIAHASATISKIGLSTSLNAANIVTILDENVSFENGDVKTYFGVSIDDTIRSLIFWNTTFNCTVEVYQYCDVFVRNKEQNSISKDNADFIDKDISDLLYGKTPIVNKFVSNSNGDESVNASFYTYEVDLIETIAKVYPYNNFSDNNKNIRSICFYDANGDFISGVYPSTSQMVSGITVPTGTAKIKASLNYKEVGSSPVALHIAEHYLSTKKPNTKEYTLNTDISVNGQNKSNVRMPCINFQFDDGHANDANIVTIFKSFGYTCGFALISNITTENVARYIGYQNDGFEAICHADSGTGMNDTSVSADTIEERLKSSKETLEGYGFKINGFVTPSSIMALTFRPLLRKYYQWAETIYFGAYSGTGQPHRKPVDGVYNGWRVSLQSTTLANQKAAVDEAIANYGCLTFYGHSAEMDGTDNLTTENLTELLTYIQGKVSAGKCIIGNPSEVIRNYFDVRNDDVSDGWIPFTASDAGLDTEKFQSMAWTCFYNPKLKLASMTFRLKALEDIAGQVYLTDVLPFEVIEGMYLQNQLNDECLTYNNKILFSKSGTWTSGTSYRFYGMLKIK